MGVKRKSITRDQKALRHKYIKLISGLADNAKVVKRDIVKQLAIPFILMTFISSSKPLMSMIDSFLKAYSRAPGVHSEADKPSFTSVRPNHSRLSVIYNNISLSFHKQGLQSSRLDECAVLIS